MKMQSERNTNEPHQHIEGRIKSIAHRTVDIERHAIAELQKRIASSDIHEAVKVIQQCRGRVVVTGVGKSAIIAQKIVATFNSTGTPALFLHAADAVHGDLGMIHPYDVVICLSKSGETPEIKRLLPILKERASQIIAIVGQLDSYLAKHAQWALDASVEKEAGPNNLAPTSSSTVQLVWGDVLAICLLELRNFTAADFARNHPGGILGKQLYLKVDDLYPQNEHPEVGPESSLQECILEISSKRLGIAAVTAKDGALIGVITDGDLRRAFQQNQNTLLQATAQQLMNVEPKVLKAGTLAVDALLCMKRFKITQVIIVDQSERYYLGVVHIHDLIKEGIV